MKQCNALEIGEMIAALGVKVNELPDSYAKGEFDSFDLLKKIDGIKLDLDQIKSAIDTIALECPYVNPKRRMADGSFRN